MGILQIALLHIVPRLGDLAWNRHLGATAVTSAAGLGAEWIITPELCLCGYRFSDRIGTAKRAWSQGPKPG